MEDESQKKIVGFAKQRGSSAHNLKQGTGTEMVPEEKVSNVLLRQKLPTVWHMYDFSTTSLGYCLPPWKTRIFKPKWATEKYFEGVLAGKFFALGKDKVKKPPRESQPSSLSQLILDIEKETAKTLGFVTGKEPPKKWLVKILFSLNPDHEIFKSVSEDAQTTFPKE